MPEVCSCGTEFVENAQFCHRCGSPRFERPIEETIVEESDQVADSVRLSAELALNPLEINFSNGPAVRVGLIVAAISIAVLVPLANVGGMSVFSIIIPYLFSGALSVWFYQRRTGAELTVNAGARMGWITGVFIFALFLVLFTITIIPAVESGEIMKVQEAALKSNVSEADLARIKEMFESPSMIALFILLIMGIYFVAATTLSSLGGMLGAKLLRRNPGL